SVETFKPGFSNKHITHSFSKILPHEIVEECMVITWIRDAIYET
ncbi:26191_t:CDS:1, partial [Gigaspora margarita]